MYSTYDIGAIATSELYCIIESHLKPPAPHIKPILPTEIIVERIGFTQNASNTPYIVYRVNDRRCCTFVKRSWFFECMRLLLKIKDGVEAKIRSVRTLKDLGLLVLTQSNRPYIPSSYVNKFFTILNSVAVKRIMQQPECGIKDIWGIYPYRVKAYLKQMSKRAADKSQKLSSIF